MQAKTEYECRKGWTKAKSYKLAGSTMAITGAALSSSIPVLGVLFLLLGSALALYGLYMDTKEEEKARRKEEGSVQPYKK